jgi:hypothetical protein
MLIDAAEAIIDSYARYHASSMSFHNIDATPPAEDTCMPLSFRLSLRFRQFLAPPCR